MQWDDVIVTSRLDGGVYRARLGKCAECGSTGFVIYVIVGQEHPHLQCLECNTTYCMHETPCVLPYN